jgi:putative membrane protein
MGVLAFIRYKKVERQIDDDTYRPSPILSVMLFLSVLAIGIFLAMYLIHSM